jgi:hypothetical protein
MLFPSGSEYDKYDGDWKGDDMNGKGIMIYSNGDKYEGKWEWGNREGKGIMGKEREL